MLGSFLDPFNSTLTIRFETPWLFDFFQVFPDVSWKAGLKAKCYSTWPMSPAIFSQIVSLSLLASFRGGPKSLPSLWKITDQRNLHKRPRLAINTMILEKKSKNIRIGIKLTLYSYIEKWIKSNIKPIRITVRMSGPCD